MIGQWWDSRLGLGVSPAALGPNGFRRLFPVLIGLKLVLGISLLLGYLNSPLGAGLALDEQSYFAWAQRILAGDWLGSGPFLQDPLYPYVLAGVLKVGGGSVLFARLFNLGLGVLSLFLLGRLVARLCSPALGIAAAALWMLIGSLALDEVTLSKEPLMVALILAAASLAFAAAGRRPALAFASGLTAGALLLIRGNFLPVLALAGVAFFRAWPRQVAAVAVAGLLVFPGAFAVRNGIREGRWAPSTATAGMGFFIGHHPGADGMWNRAPFARGDPLAEMLDYTEEASRRTGRTLSVGQASGFFFAEGLRSVTEHPVDELRLLGRKVLLTLGWDEIPGNYSRACVRDRFVPSLWLMPLHGAALWPLAVAGFIALRRRAWAQFVAAAAVLYATTLWATYVLDRFRLPLWVAAALLAPAGIVALGQWLGAPGRWRVIAIGLPALAALAWPVRASDAAHELAHCLGLAGATVLEAGQVEEARALLTEAAGLEPRNAETAFNLGLTLELGQEWAAAAQQYARAVANDSANVQAWWALAGASVKTGRRDQAEQALDEFFRRAGDQAKRAACGDFEKLGSLPSFAARCHPPLEGPR